MKTLKKTLCLVLAVVMVVGVLIIPANALTIDDMTDKAEVSSTTKTAVSALIQLGIMTGDEDGFRPQDTLTRAEAATLIARAMVKPALAEKLTGASSFVDVPEWCSGVVSFCNEAEVVKGVDGTHFEADAKLKAVDFAAMLLRAVGVEDDFTGVGYENKVIIAITKTTPVTLTDGVTEDFDISGYVTRENAAQMLFNAMQIGQTVTVTKNVYRVLLTKASSAYTDGDAAEKAAKEYDTLPAALDAMKGITMQDDSDPAAYGQDYEIIPYTTSSTTSTGSLGEKFAMELSATETADGFGRDIETWKFENNIQVKTATSTALVTFNTKATASAELTGKEFATTVSVLIDGDENNDAQTAINTTADTTAKKLTALLGLTDYSRDVEVYTNSDGKIAKIVVVNYHAIKVTDPTPDDGKVTVDNKAISSTTLKANDVVYYTKDKGGNVANVTPAVIVTGKVTAFTKDNYTINNGAYVVPLKDNTVGGSSSGVDDDAVEASFGTEKAYAIGRNNTILSIDTPADDGEDPTYNKYAMVLKAEVKSDAPESSWVGDSTETTYTAKVQVLTSDGTIAIYDLPLTKATEATEGNKLGGSNDLAVGDYYVKIGETYYAAAESKAGDDAHKIAKADGTSGLSKKVFTYSLNEAGTEITFHNELAAPVAATTAASGTYLVKLDSSSGNDIEKGSTLVTFSASVKAVINNNTKLYYHEPDTTNITTKNGTSELSTKAKLDKSSDASNVYVVVQATKPESGDTTYVVSHIFVEKKFEADDAKVSDALVYFDGTSYTASVGADRKVTYTYSTVQMDGTTLELTETVPSGTDVKGAGIYSYKSDATIGTKQTSNVLEGYTAGTPEGGVVTFSKTSQADVALTYTNDIVFGGELKAGATVYVIYSGTAAVAIFVVA